MVKYHANNRQTNNPRMHALVAATTKSAISAGNIPIADNQQQLQSTGMNADETIVFNATAKQLRRGATTIPLKKVTFNGSAANAQNMANMLTNLTNGRGEMYQSTHQSDYVGKIIGGNPVTGGASNVGFIDSHGSYSGHLPQKFGGDGDDIEKNKFRTTTDNSWGAGKTSVPILVRPTLKQGEKK